GYLLARVIGTPVPELQLVRLPADGEPHDLMAEADAEHRHVSVHQLTDVVHAVRQRGRIAWTVAQENPVRLDRGQLRRGSRCWNPATVAAVHAHPPQDVVFDPEVVGRDRQAT